MPKENGELSLRELERQDIVDSAISELIYNLIPIECEFDWDIELISIIRDAVQEVIVDRLGVMTEQEFYPYLEYDDE